METYIHPWHRAAPIPFDIDIHSITANPKKSEPRHFHYDFRYLLIARETEIPQTSELACAWQNLADIREAGL